MSRGIQRASKKSTIAPAVKNLLETAPGQTIRVYLDLKPEQLIQLLTSIDAPMPVVVPGNHDRAASRKTRRMLELDEVLSIVPVSKSTLLRMLAKSDFPQGHYLSPNRRVWYEDDILLWQEKLSKQEPPPRKPRGKAAKKRKPTTTGRRK